MTMETRIHSFIAREAHLLDARQWDEWQDLFTPEGMYWMPASPDQISPKTHVSLMYETAMLRTLRIDRLKKREGLSAEGPIRTVHHVSNIVIDVGGPSAKAMLLYAEYARGEIRTFHGHAKWHFTIDGDAALKLDLKRVDLINADGVISDLLGYM